MTDISTKIRLRPIRETDFEAWLTLWESYLQFYKTELPLEVSKLTWHKLLNDDMPIYGFGAYLDQVSSNEGLVNQTSGNNVSDNRGDGDKLVGFTHVVLHPNTWDTTECCYLEDLYVERSIRGEGVGRALIKHVYHFAKDKNCNRVYWVTQEGNKAARQLYDSLAHKTDMVQYRHNL